MESKTDIGLARVLETAKGPSSLARLLNGAVTPQAISQWRRVPAERVLAVAEATGLQCHEIRPDIYLSPSSARPQKSSSPEIDKNRGME